MRKIICCIVCLLLTGFISEMEGRVPKKLRQPADSNSSLLAVSFNSLKSSELLKGLYPRLLEKLSLAGGSMSVLFIKFGSSENGNEPQMIASNYSKKGRFYLINAKPGKYAAVALLVRRIKLAKFPAIALNLAFKKSGVGIKVTPRIVSRYPLWSDISEAVFFPRQIVDRSTIEVKPGEFAFMGDFKVYKLPDITKSDSAQERYYRQFVELVEKKDPALAKVKVEKKGFKKKPGRRCSRCMLTDYFPLGIKSFLRIKRDFWGTGWNDMIQEGWREVLDKREEDTDTDGDATK